MKNKTPDYYVLIDHPERDRPKHLGVSIKRKGDFRHYDKITIVVGENPSDISQPHYLIWSYNDLRMSEMKVVLATHKIFHIKEDAYDEAHKIAIEMGVIIAKKKGLMLRDKTRGRGKLEGCLEIKSQIEDSLKEDIGDALRQMRV